MERRTLGRSGIEVSILGLGGFHMLEVSAANVAELTNRFLDEGGNYIETAAEYGDGESEWKFDPIVSKRRDQIVMIGIDCWRQVTRMLLKIACVSAPCSVRLQPPVLRVMTAGRSMRSA